MKLLVDSHLLIWAASAFDRLSPKARAILGDQDNVLFFSAASLWELSIKAARHPDTFKVDPRRMRRNLLNNGWLELPVTSEHGVATFDLPQTHKDPFDRILVAQAMVEGFALLTADAVLAAYGSPVIEV